MSYFEDIIKLFGGAYEDYILGVGLFENNIDYLTDGQIITILYLISAQSYNDLPPDLRVRYRSYLQDNAYDPKYKELRYHILEITL